MARDRNVYAWQAYVVVMSIVSVLCIGSLLWVVFQSGTRQTQVDAAVEREQKTQTSLRDQVQKTQLVLNLIGGGKKLTKQESELLKTSVTGDAEIDEVVKMYSKDMALFGAAGKELTYTSLVSTLMQELRSRNTQVEASQKKEIELKEKYDRSIEQETKARDAEKQRSQDLANQLQKAQADYTEKINKQQEQITKIELEKQNLVKTAEKTKRDLIAQNDNMRKENESLTKRNGELAERIRLLEGEDFQYVQGEITEVSDGGRTVWINLGKADGLRPGTRFGIVDSDATRVADSKPKARIEVVSVISESEHLARARVLPERFPATILRGDKIFSPAWQPGRKVGFALVGKLDVNGDGQDDRELIKELIKQNGGEVTCDLLPNGRLEGELTVDVRWLVVGDKFELVGGQLDKAGEVAAKARAELEKQAKGLGISQINLDKLMSWLRGSGTQDVVPLGNAVRQSDFVERKYIAPSSGEVSGLFQPNGKAQGQSNTTRKP